MVDRSRTQPFAAWRAVVVGSVVVLAIVLAAAWLAAREPATTPGAPAQDCGPPCEGPGSLRGYNAGTLGVVLRAAVWIEAVEAHLAAQRAALAPPAPARSQGRGAPTTDSAWAACTREHESGGDYGIATGNGYFGAYQFVPSTWDSTAADAGRPDLVGVLPSNASPADQDAMALHLYGGGAGAGHWGGRCQ